MHLRQNSQRESGFVITLIDAESNILMAQMLQSHTLRLMISIHTQQLRFQIRDKSVEYWIGLFLPIEWFRQPEKWVRFHKDHI